MDLSITPTNGEIDEIVKFAASMLHASGQNALFYLLPQQYNRNQAMTAVLSGQRRIEDKLLAAGICVENPIGIHYHIDGMHASDRRRLAAQARLAVSSKVHADGWLQSAVSRGKIDGVPLVRVREMKKLSMPGSICSQDSWELSPQERLLQRGPEAAATILENIIKDTVVTGSDSVLTVVEARMAPNCADWAEGVLQLKDKWATQSDKPVLSYIGLCKDTNAVRPHLQSLLMQQWWPQQPQAGPPEPTSQPLEFPEVKLATFQDGVPSLPPIVVSKFDGNETFSDKWNALVADFRQCIKDQVIPRIAVSIPSPGAAQSQSASGGPGGPDFSYPPFVPEPSRVIFPNQPAAEFNLDNVWLGLQDKKHATPTISIVTHIDIMYASKQHCSNVLAPSGRLFSVKGTKSLPAMHITKDWELYLSVEATLSLEPSEICGFNVGDLFKGTLLLVSLRPLNP